MMIVVFKSSKTGDFAEYMYLKFKI